MPSSRCRWACCGEVVGAAVGRGLSELLVDWGVSCYLEIAVGWAVELEADVAWSPRWSADDTYVAGY